MAPDQPRYRTPDSSEKRSYVREMFTAIAPRYDLLNRVLSLSVDRRWRRRAVARLGWEGSPNGTYLDLCAGTLDLAADIAGQAAFHGRVVGADFVVPMLKLGRAKANHVMPVGADALQLPFPDAQFDGCTVGFGARNLVDLDSGLHEMARVIKPGSKLVVLEFSTPRRWPIKPLYLFYFQQVLPRIGRMVSKHTTAYSYLPSSVLGFPEPDQLAEGFRRAGFRDVGYEPLSFGIAMIHWGVRR
jgi:demethylmenaquinone methyltransferase/2-methoxy-6-polyprenyl-1,4-benzoquinol methylase